MRIIFVLFNFILFVHSMLFCQNINPIQARWRIRGEKGEYDETRSCLYSIQNNTSAKLLVFFIEENNDSLPPVQCWNGSQIWSLKTVVLLFLNYS